MHRLVQKFRKRSNETVVGLLSVPVMPQNKEGNMFGKESIAAAWKRKQAQKNTPQGRKEVGKEEVGKEEQQGSELKFGHHLDLMLRYLSTAIPSLQKSGRLTIPVKKLCLLLIVQRRSLNKFVKIDCPGGKRHLGETAEQCAVREVNEEVGFLMLSPAQHFLMESRLDASMTSFIAVVGEGMH